MFGVDNKTTNSTLMTDIMIYNFSKLKKLHEIFGKIFLHYLILEESQILEK